MATDPRAELRALALWHTRRRMVDEMLAPLLEYGPVAVDRVSDRLEELRNLVLAEVSAFEAFVGMVDARPSYDAVVVDLFARSAGSEPEHLPRP
jgi:hypothetical protein